MARMLRWSAIALNAALMCYYGVAVGRFLFAFDRPSADVAGFILSFQGLVFLAGFVGPALAVAALLANRNDPPARGGVT